MRLKLTVCLLAIWLFSAGYSYGSETIGSLETRLRGAVSDTVRIDLLLLLGDQFEHTDYESAIGFYRQALELSRQATVSVTSRSHRQKLRDLELRAMRYISFLEKNWGHFDTAEESYNELLRMHRHDNNTLAVVRTITSLGNINYLRGDHVNAIDYYLKAIELASENEFHKPFADLNGNIASIYYLRGDFIKSLDHYQIALNYYNTMENERNTGLVYLGMGNIHNSLNNFEKAKENYLMALNFYDDLRDHRYVSTIYISLGALYFTHHFYAEAEDFYLLAFDHAEMVNDFRQISQSLLNLGILKQSMGNNLEAKTYFEQALEVLERAPNRHIQASALRNLAIVYMRTNAYNQAYDLAHQSLIIAEEIGSLEDQVETMKVKADIRIDQQRFGEALQYFVVHKYLSDSLMNVQTQKRIAELDAIYTSEKKEQTIEMQKLELERNHAELKRKNQIVNTFIVIIIFIIIFSVSGLIHLNFKRNTGLEIARMKKYVQEARDKLIKQSEISEKLRSDVRQTEKKYELSIAEQEKYLAFMSLLRRADLPYFPDLKNDLKGRFFKFPFYHDGPQPTICYFNYSQGCLMIFGVATNLDIMENSAFNLMLNGFASKAFQDPEISNAEHYFTKGQKWLNERGNALSDDFTDIILNPYLLVVDFMQQRIKFISEDFPLYLAVSQGSGSFFRTTFNYQEIQTVYPNRIFENNVSAEGTNIKTTELKLKSNDRVYLMNVLSSYQKEKVKETGVIYEEDVISFLDKHQDMELSLQGEYFSKKFRDWRGVNQSTGLSKYFCLLGIEL